MEDLFGRFTTLESILIVGLQLFVHCADLLSPVQLRY